MHVAATLVSDSRAIIKSTLYWGTVLSRDEGLYLCAMLNSPALTDLTRPLMSYGKDERDVNKAIWQLPVPMYNDQIPEHRRLAELGAACADHVAELPFDKSNNFVGLRRYVREALVALPAAVEANEIVELMLDS